MKYILSIIGSFIFSYLVFALFTGHIQAVLWTGNKQSLFVFLWIITSWVSCAIAEQHF